MRTAEEVHALEQLAEQLEEIATLYREAMTARVVFAMKSSASPADIERARSMFSTLDDLSSQSASAKHEAQQARRELERELPQ